MHSFKQRISVLGLLVLLFFGIFGIARRFSPSIIAYVVEESLLQKVPDGSSPAVVQKRFEAWLAASRSTDKLAKLLDLSRYLEKVQRLTPAELDRLLADGTTAQKPGS